MRTILIFFTAAALVVGYTAMPAVADWTVDDGHKMHWAQTPKPGGWDVEFAMSRLADDWMCSQAGAVTDIHFWISWKGDNVQTIKSFTIDIWSNMPADDPENPYAYSVPRMRLWERLFTSDEFTVREVEPDLQGWFNPSSGGFGPEDHTRRFQINITGIDTPFVQLEDSIYWLEIDFHDLPFVGWKESGEHFSDDGVFWYSPNWIELRDPTTGGSIDLAFVITGPPPPPEPSLTQWGLIILLVIMAGIATWVVLKKRRVVTA
jgi:hypothetical protein